MTVNENVTFTGYASGIGLPDCSKLAINQKNNNDVTACQHDVIVKVFCRCFISLVNCSHWSKFHVSNITGSGVMTIYFYKGCTKDCDWRLETGDWGELEIQNLA